VIEIAVERSLCMGAGECVYHDPATFALDDQRRSYVRASRREDADEDVAVEAAQACPNYAIRVWLDGEELV
jgi:ferredoxin